MEYNMKLVDSYFHRVKKGKKKYEIRLNDPKRQQLKIGDIIYFESIDDKKIIKTKVDDLIEYDSFKELLDNYDIEDIGLETDTKEKLLDMLNTFYNKENQEKYKALAIKIVVLEKSCGIAIFKDDKVLLVHQNVGNWSLPKGHVEENETEEETALREVKEETNIDVKIIPGFRKVITYSPKENVLKDVVFFIGKPLNNDIIKQEKEIQEIKYVTKEEAKELLYYKEAQDVIDEIFSYYENIK